MVALQDRGDVQARPGHRREAERSRLAVSEGVGTRRRDDRRAGDCATRSQEEATSTGSRLTHRVSAQPDTTRGTANLNSSFCRARRTATTTSRDRSSPRCSKLTRRATTSTSEFATHSAARASARPRLKPTTPAPARAPLTIRGERNLSIMRETWISEQDAAANGRENRTVRWPSGASGTASVVLVKTTRSGRSHARLRAWFAGRTHEVYVATMLQGLERPEALRFAWEEVRGRQLLEELGKRPQRRSWCGTHPPVGGEGCPTRTCGALAGTRKCASTRLFDLLTDSPMAPLCHRPRGSALAAG